MDTEYCMVTKEEWSSIFKHFITKKHKPKIEHYRGIEPDYILDYTLPRPEFIQADRRKIIRPFLVSMMDPPPKKIVYHSVDGPIEVTDWNGFLNHLCGE